MLNKVTKLKSLLYVGLALVSALTSFLVCFFGIGMGWIYSLSWGAFFGGVGLVLSRTLYHIYTDDNAPSMWQASIYGLVACLGWLGAILCASYTWLFVWIATITGMGLMVVGVRFIDGWWLIKSIKAKADESCVESLAETLKYKFKDDDPSKGEDTSRPLCAVNGKILTCVEADAEGFGAIAADGRTYIKMISTKLAKEDK